MNPELAQLRREYARQALDEAQLPDDPLTLFQQWFKEALQAEVADPNAMVLATADISGRPSARVMLLKDCDTQGFVFFTNYESRKGHELTENPWAALVFWWAALERQVRVEGRVEKVSAEESDAYFQTRPRESQLGAWASPQSQVIPDRATLEHRVAELMARFNGQEVPRPPYWGGFRLIPEVIEFWQGRPGRLHDRIRYRRTPQGWVKDRLAP
ncbi:pyridoxamine 5'-phosphate oxidase [Rhodothermus bifroesti]|uniref:Pyridoxamine 5'-phosphate oxidase n=1 Tax=Rhodothermus marinus TaxID=29549 RepID=A0A7V2B2H5_RHOMR|nr:pyridoxamine 5'-phosphate oxidase [Rhodothermus bifroesti]